MDGIHTTKKMERIYKAGDTKVYIYWYENGKQKRRAIFAKKSCSPIMGQKVHYFGIFLIMILKGV